MIIEIDTILSIKGPRIVRSVRHVFNKRIDAEPPGACNNATGTTYTFQNWD